jgi:hypothetical protein
MGRRSPPIERAGRSEDERSAADRRDARTPIDRTTKRSQKHIGNLPIDVVDAWDNHSVGAIQK